MSTNINISVGDNKLLEQARQQQAASRQAQLEKEATKRLEAQATAERTSALAAQGKDANGNSLTGASGPALQVERRPAASQRDVTPQRVYELPFFGVFSYTEDTYIFYDELYVNTENPSQPEAFAQYEFFSKDYNISIPTLNGNQTFTLPLFSVQQDSGVVFYDYRENNSPYDATGTWPSWLSGPDVTVASLTNPPDVNVIATASITEKLNNQSRRFEVASKVLPLKGGEAVIYIHCGRWAQVFYSKDVEITWQKFLSQVSGSDPVSYYQNKFVTITKNDYSYGPDYYGNWGKAFLVTASNVKEISCPAAVVARVLLEIPEGRFTQNFSTSTSFNNGWNTDQYINGTVISGVPFMRFVGANYTTAPTPAFFGGFPYLRAWGSAGTSCIGPTAFTELEKNPTSLPAQNDPIWTDAEAVRAAIFPNYPVQRYGVKLVPTKETESLPNPNNQEFQWVTTQPPVNSSTATTKIVSRNVPVLDTSARFKSYYRDWNNPDFCRERALALGFTEADLTW